MSGWYQWEWELYVSHLPELHTLSSIRSKAESPELHGKHPCMVVGQRFHRFWPSAVSTPRATRGPWRGQLTQLVEHQQSHTEELMASEDEPWEERLEEWQDRLEDWRVDDVGLVEDGLGVGQVGGAK